ncbi:hypothetical protein E1301_Tti023103 [Triplophysa tibetana]|uniref:Uncharacterized protein n=1 Tax=Triplophysa tibetana TaxID=1572043 RepID=A0A5A9MXG0_9TELE|nr:hypothetical protein E1301_Tti023103 [Triplophysa tibetana]
MATPAKIQKADENTVEGFLFSVSPRRQSKNGNPFFRAVIQSARQTYHGVVVFCMEKQSLFMQAAKNGNAVRLRNIKRSLSFSDPDGYDILCSRSTSMEVTSLPFLPCAPPSSKRLTIAEVKALGPKQKVGEVFGRVKLHGSVSKVVPVNGSDCELKEIVIYDGTGDMKVTLWDSFANATEATKSYAFKNLCTRDRAGCIYLSTGPSSVVEMITDLTVAEDESDTGQQESRSTALLNAKVKGVEITIRRRCANCRARQTAFVEKSVLHRCEGCRLKQSSLAFVASFSGKAIVGTDNGEDTVVLISSALSTYLMGAGLGSLLNDAEAIEDHLLLSPGLDLTINADGFLLSMQRAVEPPAPSVETLNDSDEFLQEMLELSEVAEPPASSNTASGLQTDTVYCTDVSFGTSVVRASQLFASTPHKRTCLELEEEEDEFDPLEGDFSVIIEEPHDVTYDPLRCVTFTESTDVTGYCHFLQKSRKNSLTTENIGLIVTSPSSSWTVTTTFHWTQLHDQWTSPFSTKIKEGQFDYFIPKPKHIVINLAHARTVSSVCDTAYIGAILLQGLLQRPHCCDRAFCHELPTELLLCDELDYGIFKMHMSTGSDQFQGIFISAGLGESELVSIATVLIQDEVVLPRSKCN